MTLSPEEARAGQLALSLHGVTTLIMRNNDRLYLEAPSRPGGTVSWGSLAAVENWIKNTQPQ